MNRTRWRPRFGLKLFFVFVTLCAVVCATFVPNLVRARREARALEQIQILDPIHYFDYQIDSKSDEHDSDKTSEEPIPPGPEILRRWFGENTFAKVEYLGVYQNLIHKENQKLTKSLQYRNALQKISELRELKELVFYGCENIEDIQMISKLTKLEVLNLHDCGCQSLTPLANLHELRELNLQGVQASNLIAISNLQKLTQLSLIGSNMEDHSCLPQLRSLRQLKISNTDNLEWDWLKDMDQLEELHMMCSQITELPSLTKLQDLKKLDIRYCWKLDTSGPLIDLKGLTHLWIGYGTPLQIFDNLTAYKPRIRCSAKRRTSVRASC